MKPNKVILAIVFVAAGLTSCHHISSNCPAKTVEIDSNGKIIPFEGESPLTEEQEMALSKLSVNCIPNTTYKIEMACHLETDTSYILSIPWKITTRQHCDIVKLNAVSATDISTEDSKTAPYTGYFVLFPEETTEPYSWVSYVSDSVTEDAIRMCREMFGNQHPPIYHFSNKWEYLSEINY